MNNCIEYLDLISAYADNELDASEMQRAEEHLSNCEGCSTYLAFCREISTATAQSILPAPEALRVGVMEKIHSEDSAHAHARLRRKKLLRLSLTRYIPIAACLAIALLALPRFLDINRTANDQAVSVPDIESAGAPMLVTGAMDESAGFGMGENAFDYDANYNEDSEWDADAPEPYSSGLSDLDIEYEEHNGSRTLAPPTETMLIPNLDPSLDPSLAPQDGSGPMIWPDDITASFDYPAEGGALAPALDPPSDPADEGSSDPVEMELDPAPSYFAHIIVRGELPGHFSVIERIDNIAYITRDAALELINEYGVHIERYWFGDEDAEIAEVYYLPGE